MLFKKNRVPFLKRPIQTRRFAVRLPKLNQSDAKKMYRFTEADDRAFYKVKGPGWYAVDWADPAYFILRMGGKFNSTDPNPNLHHFRELVIEDKTTGQFVGTIGLFKDQNKNWRLSPFVLPSFRNQNIAQEALSNCFRELGKQANLSEFKAIFFADVERGREVQELNTTASMAAFKKIGFQFSHVSLSTVVCYEGTKQHVYACDVDRLKLFNPGMP